MPAENTNGSVRVPFEIEHHVHDVLQHPWARDVAALGDVPDDEHGHAGGLGGVQQRGGALPHLRHRPGRTRRVLEEHRLDGVDDERGGFNPGDSLQDVLQPRGAVEDDAVVVDAHALGAAGDLLDGFLPRGVEHAAAFFAFG